MIDRRRGNWYVRPLVALGILAAEYLTVSFRFDAQPRLEQAGLWGGLGWMGLLGPAVIAFGTALWILGGAKLRAAFTGSASAMREAPPLWPRIAMHLVCFAGFFAITTIVFGREAPPDGAPELWILLWLLGGAATLLSLVPVAAGDLRLLPLLRELAMPLALASLLAVIAWAAGLTTLGLWEPLGRVTLDAVAVMLEVFVSPIYFDPSDAAVGTEEFWVRVTPVCSGYEGIGLIIVFLSAYLVGFRERFRFPHVLLLLPAGIVAVWLLNVVRIVVLILVGHAGYPDIAIDGFHSKAGWLYFCAVALGAVWFSQRVRWFAADPDAPHGNVINPSAPFLLPLLTMIATSLVTGMFIYEFNHLYPLNVGAGLLVLVWYRKDYVAGLRQHLRGRSIISWHAIGIGVAVYVLWIGASALTAPHSFEAAPEGLFELTSPLMVVWIIARVLGSVLVVPMVEELAFRGFLLRRLVASDFTKVPYDRWYWGAVLISSLAFAAVDQQWIGGFAAGFLYAYAQKHRGLLSDAIVAHAVTNALIAIQVLFAGHWSLW